MISGNRLLNVTRWVRKQTFNIISRYRKPIGVIACLLLLLSIVVAFHTKTASPTVAYKKCHDVSEKWQILVCHEQNIRQAYAGGGYTAAMQYIGSLDEWQRPISTECHWIMHALGRTVYDSSHDLDEALRHLNPSCAGGYMHGVLESYAYEHGENEFVLRPEVIMNACKVSSEPMFVWECYHGLGHALTLALANDDFKALAMCGQLQDDTPRERCYLGVFMENSYSYDRGYHGPPKKYLYPNGNVPLCEQVTEQQKSQCYRFSGHSYLAAMVAKRKMSIHDLTVSDMKGAYAVCAAIENAGYRQQCVSGTPVYLFTAWEGDMEKMRESCALITHFEDRDTCFGLSAGIFARYDLRNEGLAERFCAAVPEEHRTSCRQRAKDHLDTFGPIMFDAYVFLDKEG